MFSRIQTAIENGLAPHRYLTWLMKTAKDADLSQEDTIHTLLPWSAPGGVPYEVNINAASELDLRGGILW